ncbi:hypothetical protein [Enterococcus gallinarum]|uniref:Uncharacterized protein n=1 Tax=Enterococcus gallinarum TaxID=1353 RepID=A0AAE7MRL0_ENTGA|nr:hypothetical protein [Enterococcus gallinarum]MBM6739990.1 hypothetical protein [Enterococcus gallinarum]MDT2678724.1 hypothetical protein [Enterococcus gallinarum]QOG28358.1 hypothetical protein EGM181_14380 [Enterococcus gallinarum]RBT42570.1 hypothetical protein EB54_00888 [Enterococcus gallinarum]ROY75378.1 hypothetical protein EGW90_04220 [Enterococcus gallinarum]
MEQTHERAHKKRGLLWLLLFALIICGLGAYFYFQKDPVPIISADLLPEAGDATNQRLSERAQEIADANYFTLQINPEAVFEDGNSSGSIEIVNPGTNVYPIAVDITLSNGELVYSSGAIYPNQFVENVNLITPLAKGEYQAKATINIYDPETKEKQGVTEAELTIIVKN